MDQATIRKITLGFGVLYVLIGVLGFVPGITQPSPEPGPVPGEGLLLGIFAVNVIHNIAHLLLGAILIWGGTAAPNVVAVNRALAIVFAVLVVVSIIAPIAEGVAINPPDTILHLISALVTGYLGFGATRGAARQTAP